MNIGKSVVIKGELSGSEDLTIEGQVEGKIELRQNVLTIGPNGKIKAQVFAKSVIVLGRSGGQRHGFGEGGHSRQRLGRRRPRLAACRDCRGRALPRQHRHAAPGAGSTPPRPWPTPSRCLNPSPRPNPKPAQQPRTAGQGVAARLTRLETIGSLRLPAHSGCRCGVPGQTGEHEDSTVPEGGSGRPLSDRLFGWVAVARGEPEAQSGDADAGAASRHCRPRRSAVSSPPSPGAKRR